MATHIHSHPKDPIEYISAENQATMPSIQITGASHFSTMAHEPTTQSKTMAAHIARHPAILQIRDKTDQALSNNPAISDSEADAKL